MALISLCFTIWTHFADDGDEKKRRERADALDRERRRSNDARDVERRQRADEEDEKRRTKKEEKEAVDSLYDNANFLAYLSVFRTLIKRLERGHIVDAIYERYDQDIGNATQYRDRPTAYTREGMYLYSWEEDRQTT